MRSQIALSGVGAITAGERAEKAFRGRSLIRGRRGLARAFSLRTSRECETVKSTNVYKTLKSFTYLRGSDVRR